MKSNCNECKWFYDRPDKVICERGHKPRLYCLVDPIGWKRVCDDFGERDERQINSQ